MASEEATNPKLARPALRRAAVAVEAIPRTTIATVKPSLPVIGIVVDEQVAACPAELLRI
jgi:hypothetical protein